jgi:hypothetical protein
VAREPTPHAFGGDMKTPAHPFTIHVMEPQEVVPYLAPRRPSRVYRVRPYLADLVTRAGRAVMQTGHVLALLVTQVCRMIVRTGVGVVQGIRFLNHLALRSMLFVFIQFPLFLLGLFFLVFAIAFAWNILSGLYDAYLFRH